MKTKEKPSFALEDTLAVYGIRNNPFPVDETDDFYFSTPILVKQVDVLRNLVEYGDLLLIISGVEGAGKSTFLNQFLLTADKRWKCGRIDAREEMTIDSLVDELLRSLGLKARGDDAQSDEALLRAHLAKVHADGDVAMVVVDDAHCLPQICTEFLLGLAEERGRIELRLLLTTEPGRLGFSTNDSRHVHVVVLQPFDLQQTGDYLHTRLSVAGLVGDSPFSASVVGDIHQDSGGLPGAIHPPALHTLLANTDMSRGRFGIRLPAKTTRTMITVAVALAIAGGAAVSLRPEAGIEPLAAGDAGPTGEVQGGMGTGDPKVPVTGPESADDDKQTAEKAETVTPTAPAEKADSGTPMIVRLSTGRDAKVFILDESGISATPAVAVTSPAPAKREAPVRSIEPTVRLASNVAPSAETQAAHDLDWLRKQDPSHYVIQVVGTRDASAVGKFLDHHALGSKGAWFVTTHENEPWYVVVYGMYPDNSSARAAIETLPERLRAGSPWPRSVASVIESAR